MIKNQEKRKRNYYLLYNIYRIKTSFALKIYKYILEKLNYEVYHDDELNYYIIAIPKDQKDIIKSNVFLCCHVDNVRDLMYRDNYLLLDDYGIDYNINKKNKKKIKNGYYEDDKKYDDSEINEILNENELEYIYNNLDKELIKDKPYIHDNLYLLIDEEDKKLRMVKYHPDTEEFETSILGGDDRNGLFLITAILFYTNIRPIIGLFNGEETGCIGSNICMSNKNMINLIKNNATFLIEVDRRELNNAENGNYVNYISENSIDDDIKEYFKNNNYILERGSISDVRIISDKTGIQHVNISCGFQNEHTDNEITYIHALFRTYELLKDILTNKLFNMRQRLNRIVYQFPSYNPYNERINDYEIKNNNDDNYGLKNDIFYD